MDEIKELEISDWFKTLLEYNNYIIMFLFIITMIISITFLCEMYVHFRFW